jgi:hypothetical protein
MIRFLGLAFFSTVILATGCATGPQPVLRGGMWGGSYTPPLGHNVLKHDGFVVTVDKIYNGGMATHIFAQVTVRNVGQTTRAFDPADIEIVFPATGMTYQHITKDKSSVTVPLGFNLMSLTTIKPGHMISGSLWFPTPPYKAEARRIQLSYHERTLELPPEGNEVYGGLGARKPAKDEESID